MAERWLLSDAADGKVMLAVDPAGLSAALFDSADESLAPADAELDLLDAVADMYRTNVAGSSNGLRRLLSRTPDGLPSSIAFLAVSVVAANRMGTDENTRGDAYYPRLAEVLRCELGAVYPIGFEDDTFEALWRDAAAWLKITHDRDLVLPSDSTFRKFIAYATAHTRLRHVDVQRLPKFFSRRNYAPGSRPSLAKLEHDLVGHGGPWRGFTPDGRSALEDERRRPLVVRQVAEELEQWDGEPPETRARQVAAVELQLEVRRHAKISLLARRPTGFPEVLVDGDITFQAADDGWYEQIPLGTKDGEILLHGVKAAGETGGLRYLVQRVGSEVVPFTPSEEYSGYISDRSLKLGAACAVLCTETARARVEPYLAAIAASISPARRDPTLPTGWCLFLNVVPVRAVADGVLDELAVESILRIVPRGGLRLGGRWSWLSAAPPTIEVVGEIVGQASVDGAPVELDAGRLIPPVRFSEPGEHIVEVGRHARRRVHIVRASVSPNCAPWTEVKEGDGSAASEVTVVPPGSWVILCDAPGFRCTVQAGFRGAVVEIPPREVWAVEVLPRRRARAILLRRGAHASTEVTILDRHGRDACLHWAEEVHRVAVRKPTLAATPEAGSDDLDLLWRRFSVRARLLRRLSKRRSRT